MELDSRQYVRIDLSDDALQAWRRHACLPRVSAAQREATYAAAMPLLASVAHDLVNNHEWRPVSGTDPADLFSIRHPSSDDILIALPHTLAALFLHAAPCVRMFETVFAIYLDPRDGRVCVAPPLADLFHLLQLLAPGCFALVKADYAFHEVDDDDEVAWITWHTFARALPPPVWMDLHAQHLVPVFGQTRWSALRRAAADSEVLAGRDTTFY